MAAEIDGNLIRAFYGLLGDTWGAGESLKENRWTGTLKGDAQDHGLEPRLTLH
jgi:hypothetical protein